MLTVGLSLASLACKRAPAQVDATSQAPIATAPTAQHEGACTNTSRGLQIPREHRAVSIERWDGVGSLMRDTNQGQPALPGRARGLLASVTYFSGADCHARTRERVEYMFSNVANSHYALYFPSTGAGFNFLQGWQVPLPDGSRAFYDAAMFGADDGLPGLHACAHLVELEVNDGRGGVGLHFVATAVEVIDDQYGMDVARVLDELRERFAATVSQHETELQRRYADGQRVAAELQLGARVDEPLQLTPRWSERDSTLELLATARGRAVGSRLLGSETIAPIECPPGAPCAYRETGTFDLIDELTVTHELAATYRVDDCGTLIDERIYTPRVEISHGQTRQRR